MLMKSCLPLVLCAVLIPRAQEREVKINPISIGAFQEMGMLRSGQYLIHSDDKSRLIENDWFDRFGASLGMSAVVNDRLYVSAGLGGIFQFRKPEFINIGYDGSQRKAFYIGPATEAVYHFGEDPTKPFLKLGMGNFWYKYNPEAANLGEYLFRSEGYPTYTYTGGYSVIGSAGAQMQGFKALFRLNDLTLDVFFTTETSLAPFYDWSPSAVLGYSVADGLLDLGAGISLRHLIQVKPERSQQERTENGYFQHDGTWYYSSSTYYQEQADFYGGIGDVARAAAAERSIAIVDSINGISESDPTRPKTRYFDSRSTLLTARATLDPKKLFDATAFGMGPQDLKLYGEVGVLGTKNYPIFYKKVTERMPVMVGFNVPAFGFLDLFAVQAEYLNSPFMNSNLQRSKAGANVPYYPEGDDTVLSVRDYNDIANKDNVKWSVLAKKSFGNVTFALQAANDHMRVPATGYYYGPQFGPLETTVTKRHWYLMSQISWGI